MQDAPIARTVVRLAWPAILTSLLQTAVYLADSIMLGQHDRDALASMQVQGPVMWSLFSVFMGVTVGTVALVSRSIGADDQERARAVARASMRLSLLLGVAVGLVGFALAGPIARAMTSAPEIAELSRRYMQVGLASFPFVFMGTSGAMILNGSGDTRTPFRVGLVTNTSNVLVNAVLIFGLDVGPLHVPELGVVGAAIGTAGAYTLESILLLRILGREGHPVCTRGWLRDLLAATDLQARRDLVRISAPALVERVVIHAGYLAFMRVVNGLGPLTMATNQALLGLEAICFMGAEGFGVAASTVVGQQLGREAPDQAARGGWIAAGLAAGTLTACGLVIWASASWALLAFADEGSSARELVAAGLRAVPLLALAQPMMATSVVLGHGLRGAGDTRSPVLAAFAGGLVTRVSMAWWLGHAMGFGIVGVWAATGIDWLLRTAILGGIFIRGRWKDVRV